MRQREITQTECEGPGCREITDEHTRIYCSSGDTIVPSDWFVLHPNNHLGDYLYHAFCSLPCLRNYAEEKHTTKVLGKGASK